MSLYVDCFGFRAFIWNAPEKRAGVYVITNLENNKRYIGEAIDIRGRIKSHAEGGAPKKFRNALNKYGTNSFLVEPVWYATEVMVDKFYQLAVETTFIDMYDSVNSGYNVIRNYHQGLYGKEWGDYLKVFWTDERRKEASDLTKHQFENPERRQKQSEATKRYFEENPEKAGLYFKQWWDGLTENERIAFVARRDLMRLPALREAMKKSEVRENMRKTHADPDFKARRSASLKQHWQSDEGKAALAARSQNLDWRRKLSESHTERMASPEARERARETYLKTADENSAKLKAAWKRRPRYWITNGVESRFHFADLPVPNGFYAGRTTSRTQRKKTTTI